MGLRVVADLCGEDVAKLIQLQVEYDPSRRSPAARETSDPAIVQRYLAQSQARFESRSAKVARAPRRCRADGGTAAAGGGQGGSAPARLSAPDDPAAAGFAA